MREERERERERESDSLQYRVSASVWAYPGPFLLPSHGSSDYELPWDRGQRPWRPSSRPVHARMLLDFTAFWALIWSFGLLSEPLQATIDVGFARHYRIWSLVCALELALVLGRAGQVMKDLNLYGSDSQ